MSEILFKSVNIWQSYKQERNCLVHFVRLANTLLKDAVSAPVATDPAETYFIGNEHYNKL